MPAPCDGTHQVAFIFRLAVLINSEERGAVKPTYVGMCVYETSVTYTIMMVGTLISNLGTISVAIVTKHHPKCVFTFSTCTTINHEAS